MRTMMSMMCAGALTLGMSLAAGPVGPMPSVSSPATYDWAMARGIVSPQWVCDIIPTAPGCPPR